MKTELLELFKEFGPHGACIMHEILCKKLKKEILKHSYQRLLNDLLKTGELAVNGKFSTSRDDVYEITEDGLIFLEENKETQQDTSEQSES